ncbi:MAG TPA: DUF1592 domain-containing protein [Nannocystaceae bacterium]|nr:DUF1592 domain-containing protein [Nannocystaceae bacterium]
MASVRQLAAGLVLALVGCYDGLRHDAVGDDGSDGGSADESDAGSDGGSDSGGVDACATPAPGPSPIRRLTQRELDNTLADLLGPESAIASVMLPGDVQPRIYDTDIASHGITEELAYAYLELAEGVSSSVDVPTLVGCSEGEACARAFVESLCPRAWRRPCTAAELDGLVAIWASSDAFDDGIRRVIEVVLQSADFLYRPEIGDLAEASDGVVPLSSYEIASRLSYLLWGSMPDDALFAAAEADALRDTAGLAEQVQRMLDDPRAGAQIVWFHEQWLGLVAIESVAKDPAQFPEFANVRAAMRTEAARFVEAVALGGGDLGDLLASPTTYVNDPLASFYGLPAPGSGDDFVEVELPADRHAGLLTKGAFLAIGANQESSSPVRRGVAIVRQVLCSSPPPPPPDVMGTIPPPSPGTTTRARFEAHESDPACSGCHGLFDPLGFAFEHFDAGGRWRDLDNGLPVDASGTLVGTDVDGSFDGAAELAGLLVGSDKVGDCYVDHLLAFAGGRLVDPFEDACTQTSLRDVQRDGASIVELVAALAQSDGFRFRRSEP